MTITPQQIIATQINKAERIERIREAGYEHGDDQGEVWPDITDMDGAEFAAAMYERASAPISLSAAYDLIIAASIGYEHERGA